MVNHAKAPYESVRLLKDGKEIASGNDAIEMFITLRGIPDEEVVEGGL